MDEPRPAALAHLIEVAKDAAANHTNFLATLVAALTDAAASPADPYLVIDSLLQAIPQMIAARVPLDRQQDVAGETEVRLSKLLAAWELK
jgi:hypothetical protein